MRSLRFSVFASAAALLGAALLPLGATSASAAVDPAVLGGSADTAAASCWEIKQVRPTATSGVYWLVTSRMSEPAAFYCDMATDGGGWVLVGKGRDGWVDSYDGQGSASALQSPDLTEMGPTTTELSAATVDGLLDGGRVDALTDGIRLRRATNTSGTAWQEVRFRMARRDRWAWTFGAEHPIATYNFGGAFTYSGGTTNSFGADTTYNRVVNTPQSSQKYRVGFAYGSRVTGSSAASSYLWSSTDGGGGALPYTQVYLRPRVTSSTFAAIGDAGTPGFTQPAVARSRALDSPWGVSGIAGNAATEGNVEVQAFTQSGSTMYVGGNFAAAQQDAAGTGRVNQPFLAAFDVATGAFVPSFRPVLNEQVHALTTLPDGSIAAGGEFTQANGVDAAGVVALDPTTGATKAGWKLDVENRSATGKLTVRTLDSQDGWLYIGGALTHMTGGTRTSAVATKNLGRVSVVDGTPDNTWNGKLNGTVNDVDVSADGQRLYAAGYFGTVGGVTARRAAVLSTAAGAGLATGFTPTWSNKKDYQRSVKEVGNRVYYGGSEHSLFGFDPATMNRVSGSIMKTHGDIQVVEDDGTGMVYAGCHCANYSYESAYTWPSLGSTWTQADTLNWFGAWDAATGARVPQFTPTFGMRLGSGIWALRTDSTGTMWAGGDIATVTTKSKAGKWSGGFARFDRADSVAPSTPGSLAVTAQDAGTVTLSWSKVTDAGGGVRYEVLRDDRAIAFTDNNTTSLTVAKGGANRFFVRAVDAAGNLSASTPVLTVG